jgi:hypothetical protein
MLKKSTDGKSSVLYVALGHKTIANPSHQSVEAFYQMFA